MLKTIAIIGGGITGLTAAYQLQRKIRAGELRARVVLFEAEPRLGGKIRSLRRAGYIMETGADSIVSRKFADMPYIERLGLADAVVYNATGRSLLYVDGKLKPIPEDTVFGIPMGVESLAKSPLISAEGKVAALKDLYTPNETFTVRDSLGRFLRHFLGEELVAKQIAPVLSGVYSGSIDELTIASTMPYLIAYKEEYGSIMQGLAANRDKFKSGEGKFLSFAAGLSEIVTRLEGELTDVEVRKGIRAVRLVSDGGTQRIELSDGEVLEADATVLAVLHTDARRMLQDERIGAIFDQFATNSLISVYLGYDVPDERLPEDGTGFIVAEGGDLACSACTWTSRKWTHTSADRRLLVRLFYKSSGPRYAELSQMTDEELVHVAKRDVEISLGLSEHPGIYAVTRWQNAMPVYRMGHRTLVEQLQEEMQRRFPGVILAGCSYHGVGIPDCMASGERAAEQAADAVNAAS